MPVTGLSAPVALFRVLRRRWRRSLALRVVATTLVVSAVMVSVLGVLVLRQVGHSLLTAKRHASLAEFAAGTSNAQSQLAQTDATTADALEPVLETLVNQLSSRGSGVFSVVLLPSNRFGTGFDSGSARVAISDQLRDAVVTDQAEVSTYVRLPASTASTLGSTRTGPTDALVIGAPLSAPTTDSDYELYFVFPLTTERQTMDLVQRTVLLSGIVLVLLLAGVVALVVRQVVTPVRLAARVATRFSAGRLQERMRVRGEDDLARLATSFNEMASNLQKQITRLEELSRVQHRFTADVSHELRTPLTTIRMAADVLHASRADFPPEVARSAELLSSELARFEALLADLLEISRYDAGAAVLEASPVDLTGLVRSEAAHAGYLAAARETPIDTSAVPPGPILAEVDARRVARIVRNLLANAVEHGEGRPIEVAFAADRETVAIRVRDHGVGLRPGEAALVFGRFWRGDPSRTRSSGGSGLGLSIGLEDARLHGGWLQAWGEPGRGSAFRLVLPRVAGATVRHAPLPLQPDGTDEAPPVRVIGGRGAVDQAQSRGAETLR
ncbi:MAG TPA: MtrAB system histidine kinase MtrB [Mycobacteriales bacterium]|nr:MtrAB system histidine kinase MtrB [Mycobacteriales bacterium]